MTINDVTDLSERSVQRLLNRNGYHYEVARKKGVVSKRDCQLRMCYAKKFINLEQCFWEDQIAFYFDGVGFQHKTNPYAAETSC